MAFEIVERTVAGETDKRAVVDNLHSPLVRKMIIGSDWTKIRIGVRVATRRESAWTSPPPLYFGLCSGTSSPPGSVNAHHFVGIKTSGTNWGYASNSMSAVFNGGGPLHGGKIESGVSTFSNTTSGQSGGIRNVESGRTAFFLEITKDSTWGLDLFYQWNNAPTTISLSHFNDLMNTPTITFDSTYRYGQTNSSVSVDEGTYGDLDSVCFAFLGASDGFEVSDIAYSKLA